MINFSYAVKYGLSTEQNCWSSVIPYPGHGHGHYGVSFAYNFFIVVSSIFSFILKHLFIHIRQDAAVWIAKIHCQLLVITVLIIYRTTKSTTYHHLLDNHHHIISTVTNITIVLVSTTHITNTKVTHTINTKVTHTINNNRISTPTWIRAHIHAFHSYLGMYIYRTYSFFFLHPAPVAEKKILNCAAVV